MRQLNLLPPLKQKHVINLYLFLFVRFVFILLLAATILIGLTLGGAEYLLNESAQEVTVHSSVIDKEFNTVNQQIQNVNNQLKQIEFVLNAKHPWSPILFPIVQQTTPPSLILSGLTINQEGTSIALQGKAQNRNALLTAQSQLKKLDFVDDVLVPLDNLIKPDNAEFQMTIKLKP